MKAHRIAWNVLVVTFVVVLSLPVTLHYLHDGSAVWFYFNLMFALFVLRWPVVMAHEAGHALVARAVGLQVLSVSIGVGRPIVNFKLGNTRFTVGSRSAMGLTRVAAPPGMNRTVARVLATTAAGPLVNLALFLAVGLATRVPGWGIDSPHWVAGFAPIEALQWCNLFFALIALAPLRVVTPLGIVFTDAYTIIFGLRKPDVLKQRLAEAYYLSKSVEPLRIGDGRSARDIYDEGLSKYPNSFLLKHCRAVTAIQLGDFAEARAQLLELLGSKEEAEHQAACFNKNAIAYANALLGDPALLEEADRLSKDVVTEAPKVASFEGTRGAVLLQMGHIDAGRRLLQRAYKQHSEPVSRLAAAAWIAVSYVRDANLAEARRWLETAQREGAEGPEILMATRELQEAEGANVPAPVAPRLRV